jgi:acetolactate synthase small subunit
MHAEFSLLKKAERILCIIILKLSFRSYNIDKYIIIIIDAQKTTRIESYVHNMRAY